jgi:hypothetical protein
LTSFSIDSFISLSISFGKTYEIEFCAHCSPVVSLSFLTFLTGSSIDLMLLVLSSRFVDNGGALTSDILLKSQMNFQK